jgi:hypothetical protein
MDDDDDDNFKNANWNSVSEQQQQEQSACQPEYLKYEVAGWQGEKGDIQPPKYATWQAKRQSDGDGQTCEIRYVHGICPWRKMVLWAKNVLWVAFALIKTRKAIVLISTLHCQLQLIQHHITLWFSFYNL